MKQIAALFPLILSFFISFSQEKDTLYYWNTNKIKCICDSVEFRVDSMFYEDPETYELIPQIVRLESGYGDCVYYYENGVVMAEGVEDGEDRLGNWNFYNEDGNTYITPVAFEGGLSNILGETFAVSKEISKSYDKTKMMGYDVNVSFVDAPVAFLNDVMLPKLRSEINFLKELQIMDGEPSQIATSQIEGLTSIYKNYLEQGSQNFEEAFKFYDNNSTINDDNLQS